MAYKKTRKKWFSNKERKAYWVGFGQGLSYPSAKAASYVDSLTVLERKSLSNGFKKSDAISAANWGAFKKKR